MTELLVQGLIGAMQLRAVDAIAVDLSGNWMPRLGRLGEMKDTVTRLRRGDARYVT